MRIALAVERRYLSQLQPSGIAAALRRRGHRVDLLDPETEPFRLDRDDWLNYPDLVICRGRSGPVLSILRRAELKGIPTINSRDSISAVLNKAEMSVSLAAAGIKVPPGFLCGAEGLPGLFPPEAYPLILKPIFGDNCRGLKVLRSPSELSGLQWPEPVVIAQRLLRYDGYDLKLYGIGRELIAVRKPSCLLKNGLYPFGGLAVDQARPVPVTEEMKTLGLKCADIFGLDLFGVDCVETDSGLFVIEVNDFPDYTAVAQADERLADFVLLRAGAARMA